MNFCSYFVDVGQNIFIEYIENLLIVGELDVHKNSMYFFAVYEAKITITI